MLRIGELATATGVSTDALRLYEARGLLRSDRRANGYRSFEPSAVEAVRTIRLAQRLGFTLREIGAVVRDLGEQGLSPEAVRALLQDRVAEVDARIGELQQLRGLLLARIDTVCALTPAGR